MLCKARKCRERQDVRFPLKSGYFTELRCEKWAAGTGKDSELCEDCQEKARLPFTPKYQQNQYQGKIDEPYFPGSWIFGSDRFLEYNAKPGNTIPAEDYARAEELQRIARTGSEMKKKAEPKIIPSADAKPKPKLKTKSSETVISEPKREPKNVVIHSIRTPPKGVELLEEPLEAMEVIRVKLKKVLVDEKPFWRDSKHNLYEWKQENGVGQRQGIWEAQQAEE